MNHELASGTGYTPGGEVIPSPTVTSAAGAVTFDGGDISFAGNTKACRYAITRYNARSSNKPLITYLDLGEDEINTQIRWNANGIAQVTIA